MLNPFSSWSVRIAVSWFFEPRCTLLNDFVVSILIGAFSHFELFRRLFDFSPKSRLVIGVRHWKIQFQFGLINRSGRGQIKWSVIFSTNRKGDQIIWGFSRDANKRSSDQMISWTSEHCDQMITKLYTWSAAFLLIKRKILLEKLK